jgi:hypothetical protein
MTMKPVYVAKHLRDRKLQRALMQFFRPENYFTVRKIMLQAGRRDLIGDGCDCLIPTKPPKAAIEARRRRANAAATSGDHVHSRDRTPRTGGAHGSGPRHGRDSSTIGYRPGRRGKKGR